MTDDKQSLVTTAAAALTAFVAAISIIAGGYNITIKLVKIETQLELNKELIKAGSNDRWTRSDQRAYMTTLQLLNPDVDLPPIRE